MYVQTWCGDGDGKRVVKAIECWEHIGVTEQWMMSDEN